MKKSMILLGMLAIEYANAQEGRVGINTQTPSATMNIKSRDDAQSPKNLELENQAGAKLVTVLNNGNMGINTENPDTKLHINGKVKITDGTQGEGKVLMSDANGKASWQAITGRVTYGSFSRTEQNLIPISNGGSREDGFYTGLSISLEPGIYKITARAGFRAYGLQSWRYMSYVFDKPTDSNTPVRSIMESIQFVGGEDYSNFNVSTDKFSRIYVPTADWIVDLSHKTTSTTLYILQYDTMDTNALSQWESDEFSITAVKID